jgi:hypothetical protein
VEWKHNPPHFISVIAARLIGPYIFDGPVNAAACAEMLQVWLVP